MQAQTPRTACVALLLMACMLRGASGIANTDLPCESGQFEDTGTKAQCKVIRASCGAGTFEEFASTATSDRVCTACSAGMFSNNEMAAIAGGACSNCNRGTVQKDTGKSACSACALGKFQSNHGQTSCIDCRVGKFQWNTGKASCIDCTVGKQSTAGLSGCYDCGVTSTDGFDDYVTQSATRTVASIDVTNAQMLDGVTGTTEVYAKRADSNDADCCATLGAEAVADCKDKDKDGENKTVMASLAPCDGDQKNGAAVVVSDDQEDDNIPDYLKCGNCVCY